MRGQRQDSASATAGYGSMYLERRLYCALPTFDRGRGKSQSAPTTTGDRLAKSATHPFDPKATFVLTGSGRRTSRFSGGA